MAKNMDQKRASFALDQLKNVGCKENADELKTQSAKFIALIHNSGFLQALDFARSKFEPTYKLLNEWFAEADEAKGPGLSETVRDAAERQILNDALAKLDDINEYRRVMQEAVVYLGWLKSKAEGRKIEIQCNTITQDKSKKEG